MICALPVSNVWSMWYVVCDLLLRNKVDVKSRMWHRVIATTQQPSLQLTSPYISAGLLECCDSTLHPAMQQAAMSVLTEEAPNAKPAPMPPPVEEVRNAESTPVPVSDEEKQNAESSSIPPSNLKPQLDGEVTNETA